MSSNKSFNKNDNSTMNICKNCGALVPYGEDSCLICGTSLYNDKETVPVETETVSSVSPALVQNNRRTLGFTSFVLALVMLALGITGGAFEYLRYQRIRSQFNTGQSVLYQQKDSLKIQLPSFSTPYVVSSNYTSTQDPQVKKLSPISAKSSYDHRFIGYLNNSTPYAHGYAGTLYLSDLHALANKNVTTQPGTKLTDDSVVDFLFSPRDHTLVYLTTAGDLFLCDYSKIAGAFSNDSFFISKIATNVGGIAGISSDQLLFYKGEHTTSKTLEINRKAVEEKEYYNAVVPFELYKSTMKSPNPPVLISKGVTDILSYNTDYSSLYLSKQTASPPRASYDLFHYNESENIVSKIESDLAYVVDSDIEKGSLIYLKANEDIVRFESLFSDKELEKDKKLEDPSLSHRPIFPTPEEEEALAKDTKQYEEKTLRDNLRDYFRKEIKTYKDSHYITYTLYVRNSWDSDPVVVSRELIGFQPIEKLVSYSYGANSLLYVTANFESLEKEEIGSYTASEIEALLNSRFDLGSYLSSNLSETLMIYHIDSNVVNKVYSEQGEQKIGEYRIGREEKQMFFISYPSYTSASGTLYSAVINRENMENIIYVDDLVAGVVGFTGSGNLIYQTASKDTPPLYSLYEFSPTGIQEIAYDSGRHDMVQIVGEDKNKVLYLSDYEFTTQTGNLSEFLEESKNLAERTHQYLYFGKGKYLLVEQNQFRQRNFYLLENGEFQLLDKDIENIYAFSEDYTFFPKYN